MKNCRQQAAYILQEQETAPGRSPGPGGGIL